VGGKKKKKGGKTKKKVLFSEKKKKKKRFTGSMVKGWEGGGGGGGGGSKRKEKKKGWQSLHRGLKNVFMRGRRAVSSKYIPTGAEGRGKKGKGTFWGVSPGGGARGFVFFGVSRGRGERRGLLSKQSGG